jgi:glycosyltransferase involved in cell wall biosynthesis
VGNGKEKNNLQNFINKKKLNKIIKIISYKKNPYPLIKHSDIFILSSIYEGLPNVLLEAICLKKFIISSNCPTGPREILNNGKGGLLFKSKNYKELAKKIIYFQKNKKKCLIMNKISQIGLERFNFKENLNKYYEIIRAEI